MVRIQGWRVHTAGTVHEWLMDAGWYTAGQLTPSSS